MSDETAWDKLAWDLRNVRNECLNEQRPHSSLGYLAPAEFRRRWEQENSTRKEAVQAA